MRRRIVTIVIAALALSAGANAAQAITTTSANGYWGCAGSELLGMGVCFGNPLPERLPSTPSAPTV